MESLDGIITSVRYQVRTKDEGLETFELLSPDCIDISIMRIVGLHGIKEVLAIGQLTEYIGHYVHYQSGIKPHDDGSGTVYTLVSKPNDLHEGDITLAVGKAHIRQRTNPQKKHP